MGLLVNEVFNPFNEEDDIFMTTNDDKVEESHVHHSNIQPHHHNLVYVPPEHFPINHLYMT